MVIINKDMLFSSYPFIPGERVNLGRITEMDLNALFRVMGDEENYRFLPTAAAKDLSECVRRLRLAEGLFLDSRAVMLGIFPADMDSRLAGTFTIENIDEEVNSCEISFSLARPFVGRGYACAALKEVSNYLFNTVSLNRIEARVLPNNERAIHTLLSCGFQNEGTIREAFLWPDKGIVDLSIYSLLLNDLDSKEKRNIYF